MVAISVGKGSSIRPRGIPLAEIEGREREREERGREKKRRVK